MPMWKWYLRRISRNRDLANDSPMRAAGRGDRAVIELTEEIIALLVANTEAERERCARIAESVGPAWEHCGAQIAQVIRSGV